MYFRLFTNCFIVEGDTTDLIYDLHTARNIKLQKRISKLIREDLIEHPIEEVQMKYPDWVEGLNAYMSFLVENDLAFKTKEPHKFPPISLEYNSPFRIDNAIIHINKDYDYTSAIQQIIELDAQGFQLVFDNPTIAELQKYVNLFIESRVRRVEVIIRESKIDLTQLKSIQDDLRFVYRIFNSTEKQKEELESLPAENRAHKHYYFNLESLDIFKKESYNFDLFSMSLNHYIEAQTRNVGLNKKVAIDKEGNIKNYISHESSFGNIKEDKISDVVFSKGFQSKWFIDNSQIEKCKGCIYRMMCYSCSDIEERNGMFYKKDDCQYDPSTDQWAELQE